MDKYFSGNWYLWDFVSNKKLKWIVIFSVGQSRGKNVSAAFHCVTWDETRVSKGWVGQLFCGGKPHLSLFNRKP